MLCRGDLVKVVWETLDGTVELVGTVEDGDGYGYSVRLLQAHAFASGRAPREGLWCTPSGAARIVEVLANG